MCKIAISKYSFDIEDSSWSIFFSSFIDIHYAKYNDGISNVFWNVTE